MPVQIHHTKEYQDEHRGAAAWRSQREHHAAAWPQYIPTGPRVREVGWLDQIGHRKWALKWLSTGQTTDIIMEYSEFIDALRVTDKSCDIYIQDLTGIKTGFPFLHEAIGDHGVRCTLNSKGLLSGIRFRIGMHVVWICSLAAWDTEWRDKPASDILTTIQHIGDFTGAGIHRNPGCLGDHILRRSWDHDPETGRILNPITRPPSGARDCILAHTPGGRAEWLDARTFPIAHELDMRSAYASCATLVPSGTTSRISPYMGRHTGGRYTSAELNSSYRFWFVRCIVSWEDSLPVSPIPTRIQSSPNWIYPTKPGTYGVITGSCWSCERLRKRCIHGEERRECRVCVHTRPVCVNCQKKEVWLWNRQVSLAEQAGMEVQIIEGFGWNRSTNALASWSAEMDRYRSYYESTHQPGQAAKIKSAIVATIGRFGMPPVSREIIRDEAADNLDQPYCFQGDGPPISEYWIRSTRSEESANPVHIYSYILMECAARLYERELEEINDGNTVIASNFDAMYLLHPSQRATGKGLGSWRQREHHNFQAVYNRGIVSDEKETLPGLSRVNSLRAGIARRKARDAASFAKSHFAHEMVSGV